MSLATLARRVREQATWRRPRLVANGDPEEAAKLAALDNVSTHSCRAVQR